MFPVWLQSYVPCDKTVTLICFGKSCPWSLQSLIRCSASVEQLLQKMRIWRATKLSACDWTKLKLHSLPQCFSAHPGAVSHLKVNDLPNKSSTLNNHTYSQMRPVAALPGLGLLVRGALSLSQPPALFMSTVSTPHPPCVTWLPPLLLL